MLTGIDNYFNFVHPIICRLLYNRNNFMRRHSPLSLKDRFCCFISSSKNAVSDMYLISSDTDIFDVCLHVI